MTKLVSLAYESSIIHSRHLVFLSFYLVQTIFDKALFFPLDIILTCKATSCITNRIFVASWLIKDIHVIPNHKLSILFSILLLQKSQSSTKPDICWIRKAKNESEKTFGNRRIGVTATTTTRKATTTTATTTAKATAATRRIAEGEIP